MRYPVCECDNMDCDTSLGIGSDEYLRQTLLGVLVSRQCPHFDSECASHAVLEQHPTYVLLGTGERVP